MTAILAALVGVNDQLCLGLRRNTAISKASSVNSLASVGFIDQPTTLRA